MEQLTEWMIELLTSAGSRLLWAAVLLIAGRFAVSGLLKLLKKNRLLLRAEGTVRTFTLSFINIGLYVILAISVISILGVPMASIVTVLASAGVAVGLALQGALSNLAGGVMLMIFKPFRQGDYVEAAGVSGTVRAVTLFYTVLLTPDNKHITVPNGSMMNTNVINYSMEKQRRVDLSFACAKSESPAKVQEIMQHAIAACGGILMEPNAPLARMRGSSLEAWEFDVRVWCETGNYWTVYYDLTQKITEALMAEGIEAPAVRVISAEPQKRDK